MKHIMSAGVAAVLIGLFLTACTLPTAHMASSDFTPQTFEAGAYAPKVDNFLAIMDASSSMSEPYNGMTKFKLAQQVLDRMNRTLPPLAINGALRSFGHDAKVSRSTTALQYGLTGYSQAGFAKGLAAVSKSGGTTPMGKAIAAAGADLKDTAGKIAVILVSDGQETRASALAAAQELKAQYGDRVCFYTVTVGDSPQGTKLMQAIAKAGLCGFNVNADDILSPAGMAGFVEKVFLTPYGDKDGDGVYDNLDQCPDTPQGVAVDPVGCPLDSDGDGVYDYLDKCPGTPAGVKVDGDGCPLDTDGDGVYDYLDKCPGTPRGAKVNDQGCWILAGVLFDTAKYAIKSSGYADLDEVVAVLNDNPGLKVKIEGHTDNVGTRAYNLKLSINRAKAVMKYLTGKGIAASRLSTAGYAFDRPIASNSMEQGRAANRRVELQPVR